MVLMLPALAAMAVSLGACHAVALSTRTHATVRLLAITVHEALCHYLLGPSGHVPMALLHFLKKLHQLLIPVSWASWRYCIHVSPLCKA